MNIKGHAEHEVRARAYEIYLEHGPRKRYRPDEWHQAEFEVAHLPFHIPRLLPFQARGRVVPRQENRRAWGWGLHPIVTSQPKPYFPASQRRPAQPHSHNPD